MAKKNAINVKFENLRFTDGAREGLLGPTLTVDLKLPQPIKRWPDAEGRLRAMARHLWEAEPLYNVEPEDWPGAFLLNTPSDDSREQFAAWLVAFQIALQRIARDPVGAGGLAKKDESVLELVLPWERQNIASDALKLAVQYLGISLSPGNSGLPDLQKKVAQWVNSAQSGGLHPTNLRFARAAMERGVPVRRAGGQLLRLGWGANGKRMESTFGHETSVIATRLARHKFRASQILADAGIPVAPAVMVRTEKEAQAMAERFGWPVVVKPGNQDQGVGVVPGIRDVQTLRQAFSSAASYSPQGVLLEKHVSGEDHRLLVVGGRVRVATKRVPAHVVGDGHSSIGKLVRSLNADPRRGDGKSMLVQVKIDDEAEAMLNEQGLSLESVPAEGDTVWLRRTANISTGGTAEDLTSAIHPDNVRLAERAARIIGLDIAGIDLICPDAHRSWREVGGVICEVNAQPGLRPHWLGTPDHDVSGEILNYLLQGEDLRIPVAAVVGGDRRTHVAAIAHVLLGAENHVCGLASEAEARVGVESVGGTGADPFKRARMILSDPTVTRAVFALPDPTLLAQGHPCDYYQWVVITDLNEGGDSQGLSSDQRMLLRAQAVARATGGVVANADDAACVALVRQVSSLPVIWVSTGSNFDTALLRPSDKAVVWGSNGDDAMRVVTEKGTQHLRLAAHLTNGDAEVGGLDRKAVAFAVAVSVGMGQPVDVLAEA
ncbi:cyanophycin synthetase [Alkalispirillum mobile]|uniref:Cyanophycin synthetase n=1 Tax=Alkalispirillum mobile TaxID=85925 RepID=A0A498C4C9_9GAMM|nr:acetate--CoA ligase family protein [Alkalispirillum mobile]RLK51024.1 cyanophycin synthetase [Alkalispirillum mobile]